MFAYVAATENIVDALAQRSEKAIEQLAMRAALLEEALSEERRAAKDACDRRSELAALRSRVHAIQSELREQEEKTHRLEREALVVAERAGVDAHAEALELALTEAKARGRELEVELAKLRRERQRELEDHAVERALVPDAQELPADVFAGRRVMLFTGHAVASTREAMRQSFFEFGATQVDCYWSDRTRGPESFPADAIVVIDVTFMSHSTSEAITGRAERSGAWCMVCRRGRRSLHGRRRRDFWREVRASRRVLMRGWTGREITHRPVQVFLDAVGATFSRNPKRASSPGKCRPFLGSATHSRPV
jgi:hypothetical protein